MSDFIKRRINAGQSNNILNFLTFAKNRSLFKRSILFADLYELVQNSVFEEQMVLKDVCTKDNIVYKVRYECKFKTFNLKYPDLTMTAGLEFSVKSDEPTPFKIDPSIEYHTKAVRDLKYCNYIILNNVPEVNLAVFLVDISCTKLDLAKHTGILLVTNGYKMNENGYFELTIPETTSETPIPDSSVDSIETPVSESSNVESGSSKETDSN